MIKKTLSHILVNCLVALVIVFGHGFSLAETPIKKPCCAQSTTVLKELPPCCQSGECEKTASQLSSTPSLADCGCWESSPPHQSEMTPTLQELNLTLASPEPPNPALSFQLSDHDAPIWLYKLFYPDRQKSYLIHQRFLL